METANRPVLRLARASRNNPCLHLWKKTLQLSSQLPYSINTQSLYLYTQQTKWLSDPPVEALVEEATVVAAAAAEAEVRAVDQEVSIFTASNLNELSLLHEKKSVPRVPSTLHPEYFSCGYALADFDLFIPYSLSRSCLVFAAPTNTLQAALAVTEADAAEDVADSIVVEDVAVEHQEVVEATEVAVAVGDVVELLEGLK